MLTDVKLFTADVVISNAALLLPAGTVTVAGTLAAVELLLKVTATPPLGAGPLSVTVPCAEKPPTTLSGLTDSAVSVLNVTAISPRSGMALKYMTFVDPSKTEFTVVTLPPCATRAETQSEGTSLRIVSSSS